MNRLDEIETRIAAIKKEVDMPESNIDSLSKEVTELMEERKEILDTIEKRKSTLEKVATLKNTKIEKIFTSEDKIMEERKFTVDSVEYRNAYLNKIRGLELSEVEKRAFSSGTSSAGAVIPTHTANEIIKKLKQIAPLLGEVTLLNVAGNVRFAVENSVADPDIHTENASITGASDTLTYVDLGSYEINKLVQVSKTVATMSVDAFEMWLTDMLAEKIAYKICYYLINGTGSSQPTGVEKSNATWTANTNAISVGASASLTLANVRELIALLGGGYDRNAKFLMSKKTFWTDFMPLKDTQKNSICVKDGDTWLIEGYPVMLDENVTEHEAYLGDFKKIVANLSETINVVSGFDIDSNSYKYLGSAMFDSKIADANAFVKLVKAAS